MGYPAVDRRRREKFLRGRRDGLSVRQAALEAKVSYNWAKEFDKGKAHATSSKDAAKEQAVFGGPVPIQELKPTARRALDDIDLFGRRYFGLILMPWQEQAAAQVVEKLETPDDEYVCLNVAPGTGKALALDTPVATPTGWTTMKDVQPGDEVFDERGQPCRVMAKSEVFYDHDCYEVRADDGASVIADAEHLWSVRLGGYGLAYRGPSPRPARPGKTGPLSADGRHVHTTRDLAQRKGKKAQLQMAEPLRLPDADLPLDPYVLGVWLGDGNSAGGRITCAPADAEYVRTWFHAAGFITTDQSVPTNFGVPGLKVVLAKMNLLSNKHVPDAYLRGSVYQRRALLQGLIDTDGYVDPRTGMVEFCSTSPRLAAGVQALVRSLGAKASVSTTRATLDGRDCGPKYRVGFMLADAARLPRKAQRCRDGVRTPHRYLTFTPVESVPTVCIMVDSPSGLFLAGEGMLVTHNSTFFTLVLPCWLTARNRAIRGMVGSASASLAERYTDRIRTALTRRYPVLAKPNELRLGLACDAETTLVDDYGRFQPAAGDVWQRSAFVVAQHGDVATSEKEPTWMAFGRQTTFIGSRVDIAIWDDTHAPADIKSLDARESLFAWWSDVAETRIEPGGLLLLQGQRLGANDLYSYALGQQGGPVEEGDDEDEGDDRPAYHHIRFKAHYDELCQGAEGHKATSPAYPDGCLLFPRRLGWKKLQRIKANTPAKFEVVYQQADVDPDHVLVKRIWVSGGRDPDTGEECPGCWDVDRGLCEWPKGLTAPLLSVATVDPSPTKLWALQWWAFHPPTEQRFLLDLVRRKMGAPDLLDWNHNAAVFTGIMEDWQVRSRELGLPISWWIFEANAAQRFVLQYEHVKRWRAVHGASIIAHQTSVNKSDPNYGVPSIGPHWRHGRVRLPGRPDCRQAAIKLVDEVCTWPDGTYDDQVMAEWFFEWNLPRLTVTEAANPNLARPSWAQALSPGPRLPWKVPA